MNMWYNFTLVPVEQLEKDGFVVTIPENTVASYASLKYEDCEAFVEIEEEDGVKYVGDIGEWRGEGRINVVKRLYELYNVNLIDETYGWMEMLCGINNEEEYDKVFEEAVKTTKKDIYGQYDYAIYHECPGFDGSISYDVIIESNYIEEVMKEWDSLKYPTNINLTKDGYIEKEYRDYDDDYWSVYTLKVPLSLIDKRMTVYKYEVPPSKAKVLYNKWHDRLNNKWYWTKVRLKNKFSKKSEDDDGLPF